MTKPFELPGLLTDEEFTECAKNIAANTDVEQAAEPWIFGARLIEAQRDKTVKERDEQWIEWIESYRWQGHKPMVGFDPPKGYLIREDALQALKDKLRRPEVK